MNNRNFVAGLVVCIGLMLAFGGVLFLLNRGHSRPEGVAEDWLTAVSDTVRKGVEADSTRRADKIGPLELADSRLVSDDTDGESAFDDLEVGKAVRDDPADPDKVRVAFQVHAVRGDDSVKVVGVIHMVKIDDKWQVDTLTLVNDKNTAGEPAAQVLAGVPELPSDGGPPPSSAPFTLWLGALVGSALVGVVTASLVRAAGRAPAAATA